MTREAVAKDRVTSYGMVSPYSLVPGLDKRRSVAKGRVTSLEMKRTLSGCSLSEIMPMVKVIATSC